MNDIIPPENIVNPQVIDVRVNAVVKDFDDYLRARRKELRGRNISVDCAFVWGIDAWIKFEFLWGFYVGGEPPQGARYMGCNHYLKAWTPPLKA